MGIIKGTLSNQDMEAEQLSLLEPKVKYSKIIKAHQTQFNKNIIVPTVVKQDRRTVEVPVELETDYKEEPPVVHEEREAISEGIDDSLEDLEQVSEAAIKDAYDEGYQSATKELEEKITQQSNELLKAIDQSYAERTKMFELSKEGMLMLAMDMAEEIIKREVTLSEDILVNIVDEAIMKLSDTDKLLIKVNTINVKEIQSMIPGIKAKIPGVDNILVQGDAEIDVGGCLIETDMGYVDGTIRTKLNYIKRCIDDANRAS